LLGEIRNKRGDISHGKLAPKEVVSHKHFSKLVVQTTEALLLYVLSRFFELDIPVYEKNYEKNVDFNLWLDENNPDQFIKYSKALFDQDSDAYFEELAEYQADIQLK